MRRSASTLVVLCLAVVHSHAVHSHAQAPASLDALVEFDVREDSVVVNVGKHAVATYIYFDAEIRRPYFAHVKAPGGIQVTRNHPPHTNDRNDHATMHPGIWLAFGDLNGSDFWRNQASIEHVEFSQSPTSVANSGSFTQLKRYVAEDGAVVCNEKFRFDIRADAHAYLFRFESNFTSDQNLYFGDQEEMGLGIRVATPISELGGGKLLDSTGRQGAKEIWGESSSWCDYSGEVQNQSLGITLMCHPSNFRDSWLHARDYGLLAANPFGRAAMRKGRKSRVVVIPGKTLTLSYAVWIHLGVNRDAIETAYRDYTQPRQQ